MSSVQKTRAEDTFAKTLFTTMVAVGGNCHRIDMVFDVYFGKSIRNLKRQRRSPCEIQVKNIEAGHRITQWKEILANSVVAVRE